MAQVINKKNDKVKTMNEPVRDYNNSIKELVELENNSITNLKNIENKKLSLPLSHKKIKNKKNLN